MAIRIKFILFFLFLALYSKAQYKKTLTKYDTVSYIIQNYDDVINIKRDTLFLYFFNYPKTECKIKLFSPAVITGVGNRNSIYVAIGLQGQKFPISFYIGMKENPTAKRNSRFYEPFIEMNVRTIFNKYFGIHGYVLASDQVIGYGGLVNVRISDNLGIRARLGSQQGFHYSFGMIVLLN